METLEVFRENGIVTVTMNRPAKKNAANGTMWDELRDTFKAIANNPDDRVMILTGAGGEFCSGADLSDGGACRALLSLALHAQDQGPTSVRDIATRTALPQPYLEQILLVLKGAGLVKSKRGVGGGYVLARPAEEILLSEIVAAADGPITLGDFGQPHQDGACDHEGHCVLLAIWNVAGEHMRHHLADYTLAKIAQAARGTAQWPELHH